MKIAMPVDEKSIDSKVCISFGRAPYFLVYDTEKKKEMFIKNEAADSQGGAGILAAQIVADSDADVLVTPRCGKNAADLLDAAKIKIYKSMGDSIKENLEACQNGKLEVLSEIHAGFHGHGGQ